MKKNRGAKSNAPDTKPLTTERIALVAGGGSIPVMVAKSLTDAGNPPFVAMLQGDADETLSKYEHLRISTALFGKLVAELKKRRLSKVVFVGSVQGRPKWSDFRPDWTTLKLIARIAVVLRSGDNELLSKMVNAIEDEGIEVLGVHEVLPNLLAGKGKIAGNKPSKTDMDSISVGTQAAMRLGALDAGQGVIVIGKRIVALEGAEGTDEMLERVADLRARGKLPQKAGGVLIKLCKPQQDRRVDMPTIGAKTVQNAANAKLKGIALQAGSTLISDIEATTAKAREMGLFVYGLSPEGSGD
ncbi:MAG: UDP-2,3-diacylglucosamine diphosphatase LpxI [Pseudomonadota bacterium]